MHTDKISTYAVWDELEGYWAKLDCSVACASCQSA